MMTARLVRMFWRAGSSERFAQSLAARLSYLGRIVDPMTETSEAEAHFAEHPPCPRCGAKRTKSAQFGMPVDMEAYRNPPAWIDPRGCCVTPDIWTCSECHHTWG